MAETGIHKKTISKWRKRWAKNKKKLATVENEEKGIAYQRQIEKVLSDDPRCGTPSQFTAEQVCLMMNVACESPQ